MWVIAPLGIGHQGADHGGQSEQRIPVTVVPGQATGLIGQNHPDTPERDGGHEFLEAQTLAILPRVAEVGINDVDTGGWPTEVQCPLDQRASSSNISWRMRSMVARTWPWVVGERLVQTCWGRRGGSSGCRQKEPNSWS